MTSLFSQWKRPVWRNRADGTPVGKRNGTVAMLRAPKPEAPRPKQRAYGPKGSSKRLRRQDPSSGHTHMVVVAEQPIVEPAPQSKRHSARDKFGRFVKRLVNDQ